MMSQTEEDIPPVNKQAASRIITVLMLIYSPVGELSKAYWACIRLVRYLYRRFVNKV